MKGLMNNEEAVRVFHNIKDSMINPIHQIYNLGYKQGYKDAVEEATRYAFAPASPDTHMRLFPLGVC